MIQGIISILLNLITFTAGIFLQIVSETIPGLNLAGLGTVISTFYGFMNQGLNFIYFIFGEATTPTFIGIITSLITTKYLLLPLINLVRKIILKF